MSLNIYTDGSCENKPDRNHAGWACCILGGNYIRQLSGYLKSPCTNNVAEFTAFYKALEHIKNPERIDKIMIYTDSQLVIGYFEREWNRNSGNLMVISDQIDQIIEKKCLKSKLNFIWIRGHSGNKYNELCDKMAESARTYKIELNSLTKLESVV